MFYRLDPLGDVTLKVCQNSQAHEFYLLSNANIPEGCVIKATEKAFICEADPNSLQVVSFPQLSPDIDNLTFVELNALSIITIDPKSVVLLNFKSYPSICEGLALVIHEKSNHKTLYSKILFPI